MKLLVHQYDAKQLNEIEKVSQYMKSFNRQKIGMHYVGRHVLLWMLLVEMN